MSHRQDCDMRNTNAWCDPASAATPLRVIVIVGVRSYLVIDLHGLFGFRPPKEAKQKLNLRHDARIFRHNRFRKPP